MAEESYAADDPLGDALRDYHARPRPDAAITVRSHLTGDDVIPVPYLFREPADWPALERAAVDACRGRVLDVGAGAGPHTLELQRRGLPVRALDTSAGAVATMRARGVRDAVQADFFTFPAERFDTLLMLMNGLGLAGTLDGLDRLLRRARTLLRPGGQLLADSTDILYAYEAPDGSVSLDLNGPYYGEVSYQMAYGGAESAWFPWLFVDFGVLQDRAAAAGFRAELLHAAPDDQYLARLM